LRRLLSHLRLVAISNRRRDHRARLRPRRTDGHTPRRRSTRAQNTRLRAVARRGAPTPATAGHELGLSTPDLYLPVGSEPFPCWISGGSTRVRKGTGPSPFDPALRLLQAASSGESSAHVRTSRARSSRSSSATG